MPQSLESGPPVGKWRRDRAQSHAPSQLFADLLVLADDSEASWCAIEQALVVAGFEQASLYALWVGPSRDEQARRDAFHHALSQRCELADISCKFIAEPGETVDLLLERAPWVDLIVLSGALPGISSETPNWDTLQATLRHTAPPILAITGPCRPLTSALLAYDASPTSAEALSVAAHIGQQWEIPVRIITVDERWRTSRGTLDRAIAYLQERGVETEGFLRAGPIPETILSAATELDAELLILGASGYSPFVELFVRSTLDRVLRQASCPILICH